MDLISLGAPVAAQVTGKSHYHVIWQFEAVEVLLFFPVVILICDFIGVTNIKKKNSNWPVLTNGKHPNNKIFSLCFSFNYLRGVGFLSAQALGHAQ